MKKLLTIPFFFLTQYAFAQIGVDFFVRDDCDSSIHKLNWEVIDDRGNSLPNNENGKFYINPKMNYFVSGMYYRNNKLCLINFNYKYGSIQDTVKIITIPKISKFHIHDSILDDIRYFYCDALCNGYSIDYYKDGAVRFEGTFSNGIPVGKLIFYNEKGQIILIEKYTKKGKFKTRKKNIINTADIPHTW